MVDRGRFNDMSGLLYLDSRIRSQAPLGKKTPMPKGFQPDSWTVLCGRGKDCFNHAGNKRFRHLCELQAAKYGETKSKIEKSLIVMSIVDAVREGSAYGGFVKMDSKTKQWYEVGDAVAREKVGQQIRDCLKASGKRSFFCKKALSSAASPTDSCSTKCKVTLPLPLIPFNSTDSLDSQMLDIVASPTLIAVETNQTEKSYSSTASVVTKSTAHPEENSCLAASNGNASQDDQNNHGASHDEEQGDNESFLVPPSLIAVTSTELQLAMPSGVETESPPTWFEESSSLPNHCSEAPCVDNSSSTEQKNDDDVDDEPFLVPPSLIAVPSDVVADIEFLCL